MAFTFPKKPVVVTPPKPSVPQSLLQNGFMMPEQARKRKGSKFRGLMIATEGKSDTGKTEFMLSAPGPGGIVACDRGFDAVFDNPNPPVTRRGDFAIYPAAIPKFTDFQNAKEYTPYYVEFYKAVMSIAGNPEARTLGIDADNLSWDLQKLSEWGKLTTFPQVKFAEPKSARMSFYHQLWESGKIIITSNMLQDAWVDVVDDNGLPVKDEKTGEIKRKPSGEYVAKGFPDQEYLWAIRIRHLFKGPLVRKFMGKEIHTPKQWGIKIMKCKANPDLVGEELWGENCNFAGLVQLVYPQVPLEEWGF